MRLYCIVFVEERSFAEGWYVIVAVDYWGRRSPTSQPVAINRSTES